MDSQRWMIAAAAALFAGCAAVPFSYPPASAGQVYVEQDEEGRPVASTTAQEIARLGALPPVYEGPVVTYRPQYYGHPYAYPYTGWPSSSLYFSWSNARPPYPYRGWGAPAPRYHAPPVVPRHRVTAPAPRFSAPPPAVRSPPVASPAPPPVGRPPPGGYRGLFGNPIGPRR